MSCSNEHIRPGYSASVLLIPANSLNYEVAIGLIDGKSEEHQPSGRRALLTNRSLSIFAVCVTPS